MVGKTYGTVFGPSTPPEEISGFYRLAEAPWTMVIIAPGHEVLRPIIRFKIFYGILFAVCIPLVLFLILGVTNRITARIKRLSAAADNLAHGHFGPPLAIAAVDEVGELTRSFNAMTSQLQQRLVLQKAMDIAGEVQKNLLPLEVFAKGLVTAGGLCLYCDETGGDYYDILRFGDNERKVGVVVGDVVGHGIGAALLMTTVRAMLRCRIAQPGDLGQVMDDVNRLLCQDTVKQGNFVTLFYLEVDYGRNSIAWVRCGHDPAILYSPATDRFTELMGPGMALGVITEGGYQYNSIPFAAAPHCILIYSDGAWEVENEAGEKFGRERLKKCLADCHRLELPQMLASIAGSITAFRGKAPQLDDITLAVIKISGTDCI
jgi:sigma-B regulation protein RsbU (phosphoserine phosphatase)